MNSKLNLDFELVSKSKEVAKEIAVETQEFIEKHTTTTVERSVCRLLGIDGVDEFDVPLPNIIVDHLKKENGLAIGAAMYIANAALHTGKTPQEIAQMVSQGQLNLVALPMGDLFEVKMKALSMAKESVEKIKKNREYRENLFEKYGDKSGPLLYVIVATGNIYEDITQAVAAAKQGADVIAVIRTTGQSLLDYVPYGATEEGFGGTFATQENFRLMREALDKVGDEIGRYIRLCNYCSGLCMPEIAAMGAIERLDVMLNDALYGILFRDINMKRTMVDQNFSRIINGFAGVIINTGEDNYLTTADAFEEAHTVLASQYINEQFALLAGLPEEQMGLGHAFEMDPELKDGFLYELAQAQMAKEIFPKAPLKYMPPTKFKTGDIFKGHVQDTLFNMITIMTNQRIHLLGMLTEAIHTPFMSDRALSIENASYIFNNMNSMNEEIEFKKDGIIQQRAKHIVSKAHEVLEEIRDLGLFDTLEKGVFGGVKRPKDGGKGLDGVLEKDENYYNPFIELMLQNHK